MMINTDSKIRPLLAHFEEEIPEAIDTRIIEYDETRMILLVDGIPALFESGLMFAGSTKMTRVAQETVDDN